MPSSDDFSEITKNEHDIDYADPDFEKPLTEVILKFSEDKLWKGAFQNLHRDEILEQVKISHETFYAGQGNNKNNIKYRILVSAVTKEGNILKFYPYSGVNNYVNSNYKESIRVFNGLVRKIENDYLEHLKT